MGAGQMPGLCQPIESGYLASQRCCSGLRAAEVATDVGNGGANATGRDLLGESGHVVTGGISNR